MSNYSNLLSPFTVKGVTFRNRVFGAPNIELPDTGYEKETERFLSYLEEKAAGGLSAVTVGDVPFDLTALIPLSDEELKANKDFAALCEMSDRINRNGAVCSMELISPGNARLDNTMLCCYGFLMGPCAGVNERGEEIVEMGPELRERVISDYARVAEILKMAGFQMIMIQAGHYWLFTQWLSPLWNKRTDEYGGDMRGRAKFPIEVLDGMRARVGDDMLIEYRISGSDYYEGGNDIEDIIELVELIKDRVDIIHVSAGSLLGKAQAGLTVYAEYGPYVHLAEAIKKAHPDIPVSVVGNIINPEHMESCIAEGRADFLSMARGIVAEPAFVKKLMEGRRDEIRPCQRCFNCLNDRRAETGREVRFECAINPYTYKMLDRSMTKKPRNILVAGGGVAGITAAYTAAEKGHNVTLAEKSGKLMGILNFAENDTVKKDLKRYTDYLLTMLNKQNVRIELNTEVTADYARETSPDVVFAATGSEAIVPPIPGIEKAHHALDIYDDASLLKGRTTVMIGGGLVGCETAIHIANLGQQVTVVEMRDEIGADAFPQALFGLKVAFEDRNIQEMPGLTCTQITDEGVRVIDTDGKEHMIQADNVVYGVGMKSVGELVNELAGVCDTVVPIGDCKKVGKIMGAVYDAVFSVIDLE